MFEMLPVVTLITFIALWGYQDPPQSCFEKAEQMYLDGFTKGDYANWANADSIFLEFSTTNKFQAPNQEIQAGIYRLHIHHAMPGYKTDKIKQNEDLKLIQKLLTKNPGLQNEAKDYYVQLQHVKNRIGCYQNNIGALENLEKLIDHYAADKTIQKTTLAAIYETISQYYYALKDNHKTTHYGLKSLALYQASSWKFKQLAMKQWVAGSYYNADKIDSSLYFMKEAYEALQQMPEENNAILKRRSQLAFNMGAIYQGKTGDLHESEHYLKEAINAEIKATGTESPTLITYYALLSDTYYFINDIQKAEWYGLQAHALANDILSIEHVYLRSLPSMSLSRIYVQQGDFEKARKLIDRVLEESLAYFGKDDKFTTQAFIDKAYVEQRAGATLEAEKYYIQALEAAQATSRIYSMQSAYRGLITMYMASENYQRALHYALLSWKLSSEHLHHDYKAKASETLQLAKIYVGLEKLGEAEKYLNRAEVILANNSNTQLLDTEALSVKNAILFKAYQLTQNVALIKQAHANLPKLLEMIIKGKSDYNYQNSKLFYSQSIAPHIEDAMEIAAEMYRISPGKKELNTIFKLMEINKSTVLLDGMMDTEVKTQKGIPKEILDNEKQINRQLAALTREITRSENDSLISKTHLKEMLDERILLNQKIEEIQNHLRLKYPAYYDAKNLLLSEQISYYQTHSLNVHQAFLTYYLVKDKVYRLMITKSTVSFDVLSDLKAIEQVTDQLIGSLIDINATEQSAAALADLILPPFPDEINDLIIIADKKITQIPFEMLRHGQGLLLERMNVSYAGSVQLYHVQKQLANNKSAPVKWTGFAPEYAVNRLPNNQQEVNKIGALTDGKKITGMRATKNKFLEEAPKATVLHLAMHAEIDKTNPMLSKMYFYGVKDSGELTASEVYNLDLQADLVVLSGCSTGLGKSESGDGVMSMSRAFTYAGVSSTVMSLWQVSDKETSELMVSFYENLKKGQAKNEALRNAKLSYLKNAKAPELQHPYYWAGFVVSGDVTPIYDNKPWWLYILISAALLGMIAVWIRNTKVSRAAR